MQRIEATYTRRQALRLLVRPYILQHLHVSGTQTTMISVRLGILRVYLTIVFCCLDQIRLSFLYFGII